MSEWGEAQEEVCLLTTGLLATACAEVVRVCV